MIRKYTSAVRIAFMAADFVGAVSLFIALSVSRYGEAWQESWLQLGVDGGLAALAYAAGWVALVWLQGLYRLRARWSLRTEALLLLRATTILAVALILLLFAVKVSDASRLLIGMLIGSTAVVAVLARVAVRTAFAWFRRRGHATRYALALGANPTAQRFSDRVERHTDLGVRVIGHLKAANESAQDLKRPVLGTLDEVESVLHERVVDEVFISLPVALWNYVEPLTRLCADMGKVVRIPGDGGPMVAGGYVEDFDGLSVTSLAYGPDRAVSLLIKRFVDATIASILLVLLCPAFAIIALSILARDGRPVFFRQTRVGLHGRRFTLYKFRTMAADAEERLAELEHMNEVRGSAFKVTFDPRLTRSGPVLRRTGLDELPQLWNVLRGDMSLVGPRPPLPGEVDGYDVWHRRRLSMKPGITGLWQVSARREPEFDRWVRIDLDYIDRWSLWLDFKIMIWTIPAIVSQEGR
jgi:exopolysaccharide biosynthesis polyprenyl glycosylphosphotransferase